MISEVIVTFNRVVCNQSPLVLGLLYPNISPSLQLLVEFPSVRSKGISLFDDEQLNALPVSTVIVPFSSTEHSKVMWCPKHMLSLLDADISLKLLPYNREDHDNKNHIVSNYKIRSRLYHLMLYQDRDVCSE